VEKHDLDPGLLGPESVAWTVLSHPFSLVGGVRSLLIQAMHPHAMAGVAQHSNYKTRQLDRLRRTSYYVIATAFGDTQTAHKAAGRVRKMHAKVRGIDPITGDPYAADDPESLLWVHAVEWHSFLAAHRAFALETLTPEEEDRYIAEGAPIAALLGCPEEIVPKSVAEMRNYFESVRPRLCVSTYAREAMDSVLNPPLTDPQLLPLQGPIRLISRAALAITPHHLRRIAGVDQPAAADAAMIAALRPAAAVLSLPPLRRLMGFAVTEEGREIGERARRLQALAADGKLSPRTAPIAA
jgi:uncharacterized protein (DUF2236 family)